MSVVLRRVRTRQRTSLMLSVGLVVSLLSGGSVLLQPQVASASTGSSESITESDVELVEAHIDNVYTATGPVAEQIGDEQQVDAVAVAGEEDSNPDEDAYIARVDLESNMVGVAATWDVQAVDPYSVHLRYLEDDVWSEWVDLEFEDLAPRDASSSTARAGTELFLLSNAQAAEVVARTEEGVSVAGLVVTVIDAEGLAPVDNALAELADEESAERRDDQPDADEGVGESEVPDQLDEEPSQIFDEPDQEIEFEEDDQLLDLEGSFDVQDALMNFQATFNTAVGTGLANFENASYNAAKTVYSTGFQGLEIKTRKAWGANESYMTWTPKRSQIRGAVVHHTQGNYTYTQAQAAEQIRIVYNYHARTLGWGDIGYNLIVDKYGGVWEGRAGGLTLATQGAHAYGANAETFGISIMGDFRKTPPPAVARQAMSKAIAWKLQLHGVTNPSGLISVPGNDLRGRQVRVVSGHRDIGGTDCPGDAFYAQMGTVRSEVDTYLKAGVSTPVTPAPAPSKFSASNVISDALFYNKSTMSEAQIRTFIQDVGKNCKPGNGTTCLKDTKFPTQNLSTLRGGCAPLKMSGNQAPWTIIHKTAQACGLNPQVILVTLQKEQSGLEQPKSAATWAKAMGSGCPDNSGCDPTQGGFMKQVYYGADKLVSYKDRSIAGHVDAFKQGRSMTLAHNPDAACGSQSVKFANVATASLYEYTPYIGNSSKSGCGTLGQKMVWDLFQRYFPNAEKQHGTATPPGENTAPGPDSGSKPPVVSWEPKRKIGKSWPRMVIHPGDFNGNGEPDLMLVNGRGELMLYGGRSGERFLTPKRIGTSWHQFDWIQGGVDWDDDGNVDLIARSRYTGRLHLYPGNGTGYFRKSKVIGVSWQGFEQLALAETIDGPGIYAKRGSSLYFYPSNGRGSFRPRTQISGDWSSATALTGVGDWSGTGAGDLLSRDRAGRLFLHQGLDKGQLSSGRLVGTGWGDMRVIGAATMGRSKSSLWAVDSAGDLWSYGIR